MSWGQQQGQQQGQQGWGGQQQQQGYGGQQQGGGIMPGQHYILKSMGDKSKVLDCSQSSNQQDYNDLIVWENNGGQNQHWQFQQTGNQEYLIKCKKNGGTAELIQPNSDDVRVSQPNNTPNEKWNFIPSGNDQEGTVYIIQNVANQRVLDVTGGNVSNGAKVNTYTNNSQDNQKWIIVPANQQQGQQGGYGGQQGGYGGQQGGYGGQQGGYGGQQGGYGGQQGGYGGQQQW